MKTMPSTHIRRLVRRAALSGSLAAGVCLLGFGLVDGSGSVSDAPVDTAAADAARSLLDPLSLASGLCRTNNKGRQRGWLPYANGALIAAAAASTGAPLPSLWPGLGERSYPVTTARPKAQAYFDQGLKLAYAFNHAEALRAFRAAQQIDPACAMCFWGEAYVLGANINAPMDGAARAPAAAAVQKAVARLAGASDRERAIITALARRYAVHPERPSGEGEAAYAEAMKGAQSAYPDDNDLAVLTAEAMMNLQPWDYWERDGTTPKGQAARILVLLESVLQRDPEHPGAMHLYIHMVEASNAPQRAEPYADRLTGLMPAAGHIVHMPAHIYLRLGRYRDSLAANRAAVAADEAMFARLREEGSPFDAFYAGSYYPHNVHFIVASAQMAGAAEIAREAANKLSGLIPDEIARRHAWVQAIRTAPYFVHAQFSGADEIAALARPEGDFPFVTAMWHYARGVAFARNGQRLSAQAERDAIEAIARDADLRDLVAGGVPAPDIIRLAAAVVSGRIAQAEGNREAAIQAFQKAAVIEDQIAYMEPPYWYYPVRQSLGAALLQAGRAVEAERVFRASLVRVPNNGWALFGLMQAQIARGDTDAAQMSKQRLREAWMGNDELLDLARL